eukprot:TRINITY_DN22984_c0_g2_i1.p1 TRINITY_DN22984_c0_g2~~TRINITY_DN22984_c0_g2_i1.p1  ORF type:complete len:790 (+),score=125.30 TRINITY_DN22984_c0_g2_i1:96-2465(+)
MGAVRDGFCCRARCCGNATSETSFADDASPRVSVDHFSPPLREPSRCPAGHILQTYAMPKEYGGCDGCGKTLLQPGMLTRGCRQCNFDICEIVASNPSGCREQCLFGSPIKSTLHLQGPALNFKFAAENVLTDGNDANVWLAPDQQSSWFILDLGSVHNVGGFELRNAVLQQSHGTVSAYARQILEGRWTERYTVEASKDRKSWTLAASGSLEFTPMLYQVACRRSIMQMRYVRFTAKTYGYNGCGLQYFAALPPRAEPPTSYVCSPPPPVYLWDLPDAQFLENVRCHAMIRVASVDPKSGTFALRMKCHWAFRTLNSQEDSELRLRGVPGIRIPALIVRVEESRIWKDLSSGTESSSGTSQKTVYWKGTSTFTLEGFKVYHMEQFPFDRQLMNLEQFHFVWRPDFESVDYYKSMKVVSFTAETCSMLAEWKPEPAYIVPIAKFVKVPKDPNDPSYATKFIVKVRVSRLHLFYLWQVFFPAYLMTLVSITPLAMIPMADDMGDRLSNYGGGLLTLVAFKYGVADHLPSVPYPTFIDNYLKGQIITVSFCAFVSVCAFHLILDGGTYVVGTDWYWDLDQIENCLFYFFCVFWTAWFLVALIVMPWIRPDWRDVWAQKNQTAVDAEYFERHDPEDYDFDVGGDKKQVWSGMRLSTTRDHLPVWNLSTWERVGRLPAGISVVANGPPVSSERWQRRLNPQDDLFYTLADIVQKLHQKGDAAYVEEYWQDVCQPRLLLPVRLAPSDDAVGAEPSLGVVEWEHLRAQDADADSGAHAAASDIRGRCMSAGCSVL